MAFTLDGRPLLEQFVFDGKIFWPRGRMTPVGGVNAVRARTEFVLFNEFVGQTTPADSLGRGVVELVLAPAGNRQDTLLAVVRGRRTSGGGTAIPRDGMVLSTYRRQGLFDSVGVQQGDTLKVWLGFLPFRPRLRSLVGGIPRIVLDGKNIAGLPEYLEGAGSEFSSRRHPRTGVGQTADGRILLVAVDGRQPGYSTGLTNFELALTMMRLGCVTASALDAGGSTTMAFDGKLLNRPSDPGGERPVAEALTVFYYGVYAPALPARVLSPNADGVDDAQTFAYKLVRPSTVTATLTGPGGVVVPLDSGSRAPGSYKFSWTGDGQPEGAWTFRTAADDDLGRHSTADRQFGLNNTLGFVTASASHRRVTGAFKLARPARVALRIETPAGGIVKTLVSRSFSAGDGTISWRGRPGSYVFSATATNEVGAVELTAPFRLRR
ncbi:MAG: phosphodiester glycosidase family protein [Gaiellaceae bacterium]